MVLSLLCWISTLRDFQGGSQKDGAELPNIDLQLTPTGEDKSAILTLLQPGQQALTQTQMFILQTLQGTPAEWVSKTELLKTCGLADTTFYRNLNILIDRKYIEQTGTRAKRLRYIPDQDRIL